MKKHMVSVCLLLAAMSIPGRVLAQSVAGHVSLVEDWSHRHIRYSNTGTLQQRMNLMQEPRALHNYLDRVWVPNLRNAGEALPGANQGSRTIFSGQDSLRDWHLPPRPLRPTNLNSKVDWALTLGAGGQFPVGETPAKFQFDVSLPPNCTNDFVVFPINATPGKRQANLIAVNNLYSGTNPTGQCGTAPKVMWAYSLGSAGIALSPTLSLDGKKVAVVESGTSAVLHVLTWTAGQGTSATAPYTGTVADKTVSYTTVAGTGCTNSSATVSNASPFVDYITDGAFVAADNGILYHIKGIFNGTPTMDFCTLVSANTALTSPVYDQNVGKVFISDGASVYSLNFSPTSGFSNKTSVAVASAGGIILSPIIDPSSQMIYVFSASNAAKTKSIVSQIPYSLASHTDVAIGAAASGYVLDGAFDNNFYTSSNPATWTLYACGRTATSGTAPALYGISFNASGVLNTTPLFSANTSLNPGNAAGACSPLAEFYNAGIDRLFVSTTGSNTVSMFDITNRLTATSTPTATAGGYSGGTGCFAVDNTSTLPQASSIYFGTLATSTTTCGNGTYCAVKLTQGALK
jgi:hypothetical protein